MRVLRMLEGYRPMATVQPCIAVVSGYCYQAPTKKEARVAGPALL